MSSPIPGRKRANLVYDHFTYHSLSDKSICNICHREISGHHAGNLEKHIKIHKELVESFDKEKIQSKSANSANSNAIPSKKQKLLTEVGVTSKISISLNRESLISAIGEMCTVNLRPYSIVEDSGFRKILDPICNVLKVSISRKEIPDLIATEASKVRSNLANTLAQHRVCLKADICTRMDRSVLAVNCQFLDDWKLRIANLSVIELNERHTGELLKTTVIQILNKNSIPLTHLFSFTVDNGANMMKMVELLSEAQSEEGSTLNSDTEYV